MKKEIKIYSKIGCAYCDQAKIYLKKNNIDFVDIDVETNEDKLKEMIEISGQLGVPVIIIGKKVVVGFDKEKIDKSLKGGINKNDKQSRTF